MDCEPSDANLVPGLMPRRSAGAPDPYRGSAICEVSLGLFEVLLRAANLRVRSVQDGACVTSARERRCV